jgi:pyruvate dehydrogenase E2 component (dihydrolipoamide acetyltransferase)
MREAIARAMSRANREIPHYYLAQDIDMLRASQWLQEANRQRPVAQRLLMAAVLIKAVALALRRSPDLNGFWVDDSFQHSEAIHVGVAISLRQGGLMAPAIHHADTLSLDDLMSRLRDLVQRARSGALRGSEIADPTITLTNLGDTGVSEVFGVIYPPQVALVGFGAVQDRPRAIDGLLGIRPMLTASLSADHRASDGVSGARFLDALNRLLQEPEQL